MLQCYITKIRNKICTNAFWHKQITSVTEFNSLLKKKRKSDTKLNLLLK
jgi:hypothetical protein